MINTRLVSVSYSQLKGDPRNWSLEGLLLRDVNLIVGKNATGKSKALNVIGGLATLLSNSMTLRLIDGNFDAHFSSGEDDLHYVLEFHNSKVVRETFSRNGEVLLTRGEGGRGTIFAEKETKFIDFQSPEDELAVVTRRDSIQHSFLESLYQWGKGLLHYHFGSGLGKSALLDSFDVQSRLLPVDFRDKNAVVAIYIQGWSQFHKSFDEAILEDMRSVGYDLESVNAMLPQSVNIKAFQPFGSTFYGMAVQEKDLTTMTDHMDMSTGMFRALSLFVQLNYALMSAYPSCILIDDIGEGLDYERSCSIIQRLIHKAKNSKVQIVMSSNDRFVMNQVPLEYWSVLQRKGGTVSVFNYENSKAIFDDFKYTGLNNFDFFATDFIHEETREVSQLSIC